MWRGTEGLNKQINIRGGVNNKEAEEFCAVVRKDIMGEIGGGKFAVAVKENVF